MLTAHEHGIETAIGERSSARSKHRGASSPASSAADIAQLKTKAISPTAPAGAATSEDARPAPRQERTKRKVGRVKVGAGADARKRRAGDEGERWALAAVLADLVALPADERRTAIDAMTAAAVGFRGQARG